jgi:hypothetical protein
MEDLVSTFTCRGADRPTSFHPRGVSRFVSRGRSFLLPTASPIADPIPTRYERIDKTMPERVTVARDRLFNATPEVRHGD